MSIAAAASPLPGRSMRVLQVTAVMVIVLSAGADAATTAVSEAPWREYLPVLVTAAGVICCFRVPYIGLALVAAAPIVAAATGHVATAIWSIACFAGFLLVLRGVSAPVAGGVLAAANLVGAIWSTGTIDPAVDPSAAVAPFAAVVCVAIASAIRSNRRYRLEVEQRLRDVDAARRTAVDRGIATERLRIARDLHDSVGHQIAVVNMRLGAAEVHLPPGADAARADLSAARQGVQAVLRETQQILTVLRVEGSSDEPGMAFGHEHIGELVASSRAAGLRLDGNVGSLDRPMSPQASAAAYRIAQEAITNASKHGTGAVSLTVAQDGEGTIMIDVHNLVPSRNGSRTEYGGNGLVGMQERATSVGGTVETRTVGGVFTLRAIIPAHGDRA